MIAFGIAVSTILGRFVIPIYYVLGERLIDHFARGRGEPNPSHPAVVEDQDGHLRPGPRADPGGRPLSLADGVEGRVSRR